MQIYLGSQSLLLKQWLFEICDSVALHAVHACCNVDVVGHVTNMDRL